MPKTRKPFPRSLSLTRIAVGSGLVLFASGLLLLQTDPAPAQRNARETFIWAGWALTAGWLMGRVRARQWPFTSGRFGQGILSVSNRLRVTVSVLSAAGVCLLLFVTYGPLLQGAAPRQSALGRSAGSRFDGLLTYSLLPAPDRTLSLTALARPWDFPATRGRPVTRAGSAPAHAPARFSSQVPFSPRPALGGLPSSWHIQP